MEKPITHIEIGGKKYPIAGQEVRYKYVPSERIPEFLATNPARGEVFIDDKGTIYIVDKGDLELYWLRQGRQETYPKKDTLQASEGFLDDIQLDLF